MLNLQTQTLFYTNKQAPTIPSTTQMNLRPPQSFDSFKNAAAGKPQLVASVPNARTVR